MPLIDAHIHYSHDAWDVLPPAEAVKALRTAGLQRAFVSSSNDDGTQRLYALAPDLIVPVLLPYRRRGELAAWHRDPTVIDMLSDRLAKNRYAGIGEFHVFGAGADQSVLRSVVNLAAKCKIFLHAHSDVDAIDRIFLQNPDARVLWAHSGFASPEDVLAMLLKHQNLWSYLAFRSEQASDGKVDPAWRKAFEAFQNRFMLGTDTFVPERWYYVANYANSSRVWLADLPTCRPADGFGGEDRLQKRGGTG
jgi:predicted TIM-barrel fold metal-dependent hydrolase